MAHHHSDHGQPSYSRAFAIAIMLNIGFVVTEAVFGLLTHSLALLADAGHNLGDVLGLGLAWGASWLVQLRPTHRYTYGLRRSSILVALLNAMILLFAMGAIAIEAIQRVKDPVAVSGETIIGVALVGIVINGTTALLFISGRKRDLNLRGAFLHMAADALVSLGVVLAGVAILATGWLWFDPVISLVIVIVIMISTWNLLRDSLNLALDAVPPGVEPLAIRTYLDETPGVVAIHDLHIWAMSTTETALTAHLVMPTGCPDDVFLARISQDLHDRFDIEHTTIQIETGHSILSCAQKSCCD